MKRGEIKLLLAKPALPVFYFAKLLFTCGARRAHYKIANSFESWCAALDAFAMMISSHIMQSDGFLLYRDDLYILCAQSGINLVVSKTSARSLSCFMCAQSRRPRFSLIIFPHLHHGRKIAHASALLAESNSLYGWGPGPSQFCILWFTLSNEMCPVHFSELIQRSAYIYIPVFFGRSRRLILHQTAGRCMLKRCEQ